MTASFVLLDDGTPIPVLNLKIERGERNAVVRCRPVVWMDPPPAWPLSEVLVTTRDGWTVKSEMLPEEIALQVAGWLARTAEISEGDWPKDHQEAKEHLGDATRRALERVAKIITEAPESATLAPS